MSTQGFKQDVFAQLARIGKALGHANRLELLEFIAQGPRSVDELAGLCGLSVANASKHLQEMRRAGLVKARKEGISTTMSLRLEWEILFRVDDDIKTARGDVSLSAVSFPHRF